MHPLLRFLCYPFSFSLYSPRCHPSSLCSSFSRTHILVYTYIHTLSHSLRLFDDSGQPRPSLYLAYPAVTIPPLCVNSCTHRQQDTYRRTYHEQRLPCIMPRQSLFLPSRRKSVVLFQVPKHQFFTRFSNTFTVICMYVNNKHKHISIRTNICPQLTKVSRQRFVPAILVINIERYYVQLLLAIICNKEIYFSLVGIMLNKVVHIIHNVFYL